MMYAEQNCGSSSTARSKKGMDSRDLSRTIPLHARLVGLQRLEGARGRKSKRRIVLLQRTEAFAQLSPQLRSRFSQGGDHFVFVVCFLLLPRDEFSALRIDRFQSNQVVAPDRVNLGDYDGLQTLPFADFDTEFLRHTLIGFMAHRAHRLADGRLRQEAQERRLGELDFERLVQIVEDGVTCLVDETRQENDVGPGQRRPGEEDAPRHKGGNH